MKRFFSVLTAFVFLSVSAFAWNFGGDSDFSGGLSGFQKDQYELTFPSGLTFYADYENDSNLTAEYSEGSPLATFTRTACNATYVDADGVIRVERAANAPRFTSGYYGATGFHGDVPLG